MSFTVQFLGFSYRAMQFLGFAERFSGNLQCFLNLESPHENTWTLIEYYILIITFYLNKISKPN